MNDGHDLGTGTDAEALYLGLGSELAGTPADEGAGLAAGPDTELGVTWAAPLTAYKMTGLRAAGEGSAAQEIWKQLGVLEQADVLAALGAQVRNGWLAVQHTRGIWADSQVPLSDRLRLELCSEAAKALAELLRPDAAPWQLPECRHCRELIVTTLVDLSIRCAGARGISPMVYAGMCAESARG